MADSLSPDDPRLAIIQRDVHALFDRLRTLRVLVVGDLMLDRYLWGRVTRISPEAPVPVVDVQREESRPGGAANVAMNLRGLGVQVQLCGTIGLDADGERFRQVLQASDIPYNGLIALDPAQRRTTTKIRVIGQNQQMLRIDQEDNEELPEPLQAMVTQRLKELLAENYDVVIFEDYDKGIFSSSIIRAAIQEATQRGTQILVDPKFRNFFNYTGATLFKPNLKELNEALGTHYERADIEGVKEGIHLLRQRMPHQYTLVTLSEHGVLIADPALRFKHYPAHYRQIVDVSGAGDTVIGVMAAMVGAGVAPMQAAELANLAGGLVCEEVGVVPIRQDQLAAEIIHLRAGAEARQVAR